jgi:hypothetical protein
VVLVTAVALPSFRSALLVAVNPVVLLVLLVDLLVPPVVAAMRSCVPVIHVVFLTVVILIHPYKSQPGLHDLVVQPLSLIHTIVPLVRLDLPVVL